MNDPIHTNVKLKRFVGWARVSTARQKLEGFSLADQEARLHEFARRLGGELVKVYRIAETATRGEERAEFRGFEKYVNASARRSGEGRLNGMLFVKVDRASRNLRDWADLEELSERTGVPLLFPDQPEGNTAAGRMQRRMSAVFAAYQTDQQATDIRAGIRRRQEAGLPVGGRVYGYQSVRVNGRAGIEIDPVHGPKVRRVFELFAHQRLTVNELGAALARQGVVHTVEAPEWRHSTLYRLLNNRAYLGMVRIGGRVGGGSGGGEAGSDAPAKAGGSWLRGAFEPLVDRATFDLVQARLRKRVFAATVNTFAGGVVMCGCAREDGTPCGRQITGETIRRAGAGGKPKAWTYYRCTDWQRHAAEDVARGSVAGKRGVKARWRVAERELDGQCVGFFESMRMDDEVRAWLVAVIKARAAGSMAEGRAARAELGRSLEAIKGLQEKVLNMRIAGEISAEVYRGKRAELEDREAGVLARMRAGAEEDRGPGGAAALALATVELSQSLVSRWDSADARVKREILGLVCERVELNSGKLSFIARKPFDLMIGGLSVGEVEQGGRELNFVDAVAGWDARTVAVLRRLIAA